MRDSAGVPIVESTTPSWEGDRMWRVDSQPAVRIGTRDAPETEQLFRVVGAHRMVNGRIVIANAGTQELRFFDPDGRLLHAAGGYGEGPGEFLNLRWIQVRAGDSIVAFDNTRRISVFDARGSFVRSLTLGSSAQVRLPIPIIVFPGGTFLAEAAKPMLTDPTSSLVRTTADLYLYDSTGEFIGPLGSFAANDTWVGRRSDGRFYRTAPLFGRTTQIRRQDSLFVIADNADYELELYDQAGVLRRIVRRLRRPIPVTREMFSAALRAQLGGNEDPNERRTLTRWYEGIPGPTTLPAYGDVLVDDLGNFWIHEYVPPGIPDSNKWTVLDRTGLYRGDVTLPPGLRLFQIGADFILGVWRDLDDVEQVHLYRLHKPPTV